MFRLKMGRRGSPRAHTLGKWSHGPQDHFKIAPGPRNLIVNIKTIKNCGVGGYGRVRVGTIIFSVLVVAIIVKFALLDIHYCVLAVMCVHAVWGLALVSFYAKKYT